MIREVVEKAGHTLALLEKYKTPQELHAAVADADAMIVRSDIVDAAVIAAAPKLKIVVRAGAGYDNLDLNACIKGKHRCNEYPGPELQCRCRAGFRHDGLRCTRGFDGKSGSELMGRPSACMPSALWAGAWPVLQRIRDEGLCL